MIYRALTEIHEIELSSRCNLACIYCPHPTMTRPKVDMSWDVFYAAVRLAQKLDKAGTQKELSFTGIGEALLHPEWGLMIVHARALLPFVPFLLATNGIEIAKLRDDEIDVLRDQSVTVYVSLHRPELAAPAIEALKRRGVSHFVNHAFVDSSMDWAGQVPWYVSMRKQECQYLKRGWGVVRVDGRITTCCMDAHTLHAFGTVFDPLESLKLSAHSLCGSCNLSVPKELIKVHTHA
jgi:hypothetical protein